ncbi:uncharacterized protein LOC125944493 [Dermacentor silvarum]|uniref:uncharacterized protein LOC125944493 n=1 Tax=Dermacentor silvarum TaxID=543639 RepID=UPI002100BBAB|nr:uncharacterized protein LOC125944493 [Dermacentor silvarum]
MPLLRFWRRKVQRRASDDGPVYVLDLNSPAASVREPCTSDAVHYGEKGSTEGRSVLVLSIAVGLLAVLAVGFALGVIFRETATLAPLEPITDFRYKGPQVNREKLAYHHVKNKTPTGTNGVQGHAQT